MANGLALASRSVSHFARLLLLRIRGHAVYRALTKKEPRRATMLDSMRKYFLDDCAPFPPTLRLFFWPYRGLRQTILRGVGVVFRFTQQSPPPTVVGDFLKYFPVTVWLASNAPDFVTRQLEHREICPRDLAMDAEAQLLVPICPSDTFPPDWPEHPREFEIFLLDAEACVYAEPT